MQGKLTPYAEKIILKRLEAAKKCTSTTQRESLATSAFARAPTGGAEVCSVHDSGENTYYKVNLRHQTCTCCMWQEHGIPCKHACAVLLRRNQDPRDSCAQRYTLDTYRLMFQAMDPRQPVTRAQLFAHGARNLTIKAPAHGPYGTIVDKKTNQEIAVCLCTFCGKKNIIKKPGPGKTKRLVRAGKGSNDC